MKVCRRRCGIITLFLFLTIMIWMNVYVGVPKSISERSSEQDVYNTKLDQIKETVNKLGESKLKDGVKEITENFTFKNGYKFKENVVDILY